MGLKNNTVDIESYNNEWPKIYEREEKYLERIFGDLAIIIEHIGSTSVEGLSAKPVIDIVVGMIDLKDFGRFKNKIKPPYYVKLNPTKDEELIIKEENDITTCLIHIMEIDSKRCRDTITFRNYLREHKDVLEEYENLKKELALKYQNDRSKYTASKNDFIKKILEKAYKEG